MIDSQVFKEPKMVMDGAGTLPPFPCERLKGGHWGVAQARDGWGCVDELWLPP